MKLCKDSEERLGLHILRNIFLSNVFNEEIRKYQKLLKIF